MVSLILWLSLFLIGSIGGLLVGLVGLGSTLVVLPTLIILFSFLFHATVLLKLAIGTTLACGMTGAAVSAYHYNKQGNVKLAVVFRVAPVYILTAIVGPTLVHYMPIFFLHLLTGLVLILISGVVIFSHQVNHNLSQRSMNSVQLSCMALLAGMVTSMSGVATGVILLPYLSRYLPRMQAVGTSVSCAVVGCGIATVSYIISGLHQSVTVLPRYSLGYVYLPAYGVVALAILVFTPLGVRLAQQIDTEYFKWLLAALLSLSGLYSIWLVL